MFEFAVETYAPPPYDFGPVTVNPNSSPAQMFVLENAGGNASSAVKVALSGSSAFTVTSDTGSATRLGPEKSCTVAAWFAPTSTGTAAARMTATSNKRDDTATASLSGTGVPAAHRYWAHFGAGTIVEANLDCTGQQTLATGQSGPAGVAVSPQP